MEPSDLIISKTDGRPMYLQIVDQIKQLVAIGDWPGGGEIPSIRLLATGLRVSVITVKRAYYELEREGVIVTQQGKPSTVALDLTHGSKVYDEELARLVEQIARLATRLGVAPDEVAARVRDAMPAANDSSTEQEQ